jgi:hypothetical protein
MGGGGRLGAEATPLGESEGRDAKGVPTPCPRSPSPSHLPQSGDPEPQSKRRQTTTSSVTLRWMCLASLR